MRRTARPYVIILMSLLTHSSSPVAPARRQVFNSAINAKRGSDIAGSDHPHGSALPRIPDAASDVAVFYVSKGHGGRRTPTPTPTPTPAPEEDSESPDRPSF